MTRILGAIVVVIAIVLGLGFAQINAAEVTLNYYFDSLSAPLSLLLALTLGLGVLLGVLAGSVAIFRSHRELARLRRQIKLREEEVMNLRAIPLKDFG